MPEVQGFETLKFEVVANDMFIRQGEEQVHFPVDYLAVVVEQMKLAKKIGPKLAGVGTTGEGAPGVES